MARRMTEVVDEAVNLVDLIGEKVSARYPEAHPEFIAAKTAETTQMFAALKLDDAVYDLMETIRNWTP